MREEQPPDVLLVALLAEGVDRNQFQRFYDLSKEVSPSSRRAWIEIFELGFNGEKYEVALLAEGVDRNML